MLWFKVNPISVYLLIFDKLDFVKLIWLKLSLERCDFCIEVKMLCEFFNLMQKLFFITSSLYEICRQKYFYLTIFKRSQNQICDFKSVLNMDSNNALNHISTHLYS